MTIFTRRRRHQQRHLHGCKKYQRQQRAQQDWGRIQSREMITIKWSGISLWKLRYSRKICSRRTQPVRRKIQVSVQIVLTGPHRVKGSVARDFLPLVFSMNRPHIVPEFTPWNIFEFFFEFGEIFVFECCSAGFETPQDFVPRGLIPRGTLLSGVSDPAGCCSPGYQTPQNKCML